MLDKIVNKEYSNNNSPEIIVMQIVLGSSSNARKKVLQQLKIPFICISPDIDEKAKDNENTSELVLRLGREKAYAICKKCSIPSLIISGDQVLEVDGKVLGKPLTNSNAIAQLKFCSGKKAIFYSSICLLNSATDKIQAKLCITKVNFKQLTDTTIAAYVAAEQPKQCAGSFKAEGLGIALVDAICSDDPSAILGLPLVSLCKMLAAENFSVIEKTEIATD